MPRREAICPVCGRTSAEEFLHRPSVPVHQNLLCCRADQARAMARGQLAMRVCTRCGFVYNARFDPALLAYGQHYDNTQTHSAAFQSHVSALVKRLLDVPAVRNGTVVEVGCGKGDFLRQLVEAAGTGCRGIGFDPAYTGETRLLNGRLVFHRQFYDQRCAEIPADVVLCRHVIEHIHQPVELLRSVRRALSNSPHAQVFFETPCVEWILRHQVIWDFFYEHCSLFTADSLATAFRRAGFRIASVDHVFDGQYLWQEATLGEPPANDRAGDAAEVVAAARRFAATETRLTEGWRQQIRNLNRQGGVVLWGAGAKGCTFGNLVDPQRRWLRAVVDVNPQKQGRYLPGTGHPIVAPHALRSLGAAAAILLNPNYRREVAGMIQELGLSVALVDLMHERAIAA